MIQKKRMTDNELLQVPRYLGLLECRPVSKGRYSLHLGFTNRTKKIVTVDEEGLAIIRYFLKPGTVKQAALQLGFRPREVKEVCLLLLEAGILKKHFSVSETISRYDRHLLFYDLAETNALETQKKLSRSRVALIGMGGIGNWVSSGLIGAGLKEIRLIDFDRVELTNLTRQVLFEEKDIGKLKTRIAKQRLQPKNRDTKISVFHSKIDGIKTLFNCLKGIDFVVLSADRPAQIHDWVDAVTLKKGIPYLNIGYRDGTGVVGPLTLHGLTSCYQCFKTAKVTSHSPDASTLMEDFECHYQAPSFGPLNAMVSSIGVLELMKYLGEFGNLASLDNEITLDPLDLTLKTISYQRDPKCWHCGGLKSK